MQLVAEELRAVRVERAPRFMAGPFLEAT